MLPFSRNINIKLIEKSIDLCYNFDKFTIFTKDMF